MSLDALLLNLDLWMDFHTQAESRSVVKRIELEGEGRRISQLKGFKFGERPTEKMYEVFLMIWVVKT